MIFIRRITCITCSAIRPRAFSHRMRIPRHADWQCQACYLARLADVYETMAP